MFNLRVEVNIMRDLDTLQREHRESTTPQTLARFQHHHQLLAELIEWNDHNIEGPSKGAPKREPKQLRDGQKIGATIIPFGTVAAAASAAAASADCSPSTIVVDREADCPRSEAARDASSQVELYVLKVPASLVSLIGPAFKTENRTKLSRGQQDLLVLLIIATDQLFKRDEINSSSALGHAIVLETFKFPTGISATARTGWWSLFATATEPRSARGSAGPTGRRRVRLKLPRQPVRHSAKARRRLSATEPRSTR